MKIKSVLSQSAFWQINKALAQKVGIESALLLSDLIDRESYFDNRNMLIDINGEGYFFVTSKQILDATTLSYRKQKGSIKTLENEGMIKTFLRGVPAKLHFTICESKIWQSVNTSISETVKLDLAETQNKNERNAKTINNNKEIIIDNNNKNNKVKENKPSNLLEVEEYFIFKKSNKDEAENFFEYYENNGWKVGRVAMKKWKYAANKWIKTARPKFNNEKPSLAKKYFPEMFEVKGDPFETNLKLE